MGRSEKKTTNEQGSGRQKTAFGAAFNFFKILGDGEAINRKMVPHVKRARK